MENDGPQLGKIIEGDAARDAVHVAIAPVTATEGLSGGERIGIRPDGNGGYEAFLAQSGNDDAVAVVDPFLVDPVAKHQRFYALMLPGSVTGLRHVYTHPSFKAKVPEIK